MEYDQKTLRAVQLVTLEILQDVIRVCDENSLDYFAIGGTDLGAMRHDGFIPWDDDIDIGMLRDDYQRFLEIAPEKLSKGYTLQWYGTDPNTPVYSAKVRKDGTRFVEMGMESVDMHHGIFVDIMPFDEIPRNEKELKRYRLWSRIWKEIYIGKSIRKLTAVGVKPALKAAATVYRTIVHIILLPVSKDWIFKKYDSYLRKYNGSGSGRWSSRGRAVFECDLEDLLPAQWHVFEDTQIKIPAHPDTVLTTQYGNWREIPPEGKRINHNLYELSFGEDGMP